MKRGIESLDSSFHTAQSNHGTCRACQHENHTGNLQPSLHDNQRKTNPRNRFLDFLVDLFAKYV